MSRPPHFDLFVMGSAFLAVSLVPMYTLNRVHYYPEFHAVDALLVDVAGVLAPAAALIGAGCWWMACVLESKDI